MKDVRIIIKKTSTFLIIKKSFLNTFVVYHWRVLHSGSDISRFHSKKGSIMLINIQKDILSNHAHKHYKKLRKSLTRFRCCTCSVAWLRNEISFYKYTLLTVGLSITYFPLLARNSNVSPLRYLHYRGTSCTDLLGLFISIFF